MVIMLNILFAFILICIPYKVLPIKASNDFPKQLYLLCHACICTMKFHQERGTFFE